jgi:hypothetical protein
LKVGDSVVLVRHYVLIEDVFDSIKFAVFLWFLTYVGAIFNLLTLLILGHVSFFTLPKVQLWTLNMTLYDSTLQTFALSNI